jgi:G3E family GTPase
VKTILISGFLGSGKTTLALELARLLKRDGVRTALVINEVGEVGIDADLFAGEDRSQLFEIFSGCVCCQVGSDLVETLKSIDADESVQWAIIEPSGVAYTSQILDTIGYWNEDAHVVQIVLIDGPRLPSLIEHLDNLIRDSLHSANIIVVSKQDLMDPASTNEVFRRVDDLAPGVPVISGDLLRDAPRVASEVFTRFVSS